MHRKRRTKPGTLEAAVYSELATYTIPSTALYRQFTGNPRQIENALQRLRRKSAVIFSKKIRGWRIA